MVPRVYYPRGGSKFLSHIRAKDLSFQRRNVAGATVADTLGGGWSDDEKPLVVQRPILSNNVTNV